MTKPPDACQQCVFFEGIGIPEAALGYCKRYAPRPVSQGGDCIASWPEVDATEWCGEFRLKVMK